MVLMPGSKARHSRAIVPSRLVKRGGTLLHQQCWCWGQDIRSPRGNLLMTHGFERRRPPSADAGQATCYVLHTSTHATVRLWGFGLAYTPQQGTAVFSGRYRFAPTPLTCPSVMHDVWSGAGMPDAIPATAIASPTWWTMVAAMRWMATYERWIPAAAGDGWRAATTKGWREAAVPGDALGPAWDELAEAIEATVLERATAR
jgi:hypothetical protein